MYKGKKILGIIPARGSSKDLPRKNVLSLLEKPLIAWTIEEARSSDYLDKIIVSTDDKEIAGISEKYGAEIPFKRPKILSSGKAKTIDVILHALKWFEGNGCVYDLVMLLQPASPLRTVFDINEAVKLLINKKAQSIVSVCESEHHLYWSNTLPGDGCMKDFLKKEIIGKNRQELPVFYRLNGAVYLAY